MSRTRYSTGKLDLSKIALSLIIAYSIGITPVAVYIASSSNCMIIQYNDLLYLLNFCCPDLYIVIGLYGSIFLLELLYVWVFEE